jgi:8-oxo-dGTP diphosphatase/2-hydroxy-dATP diphosphatase
MKNKKILTLCMVATDTHVLLGMKKRGFGAGRWNGFGGKVEAGESIEQAAVREVEEEVALTPTAMGKVGILEFSFESEPDVLEVHIFKVTSFSGEPQESEEMKPQWFAWNDVPFAEMWVDDEHWFPYLKKGERFKGSFLFDRPATPDHAGAIVSQSISVVSEL